ncbi:hypothetical protein GCM10009529_31520 [Micropruina glycogenica]
MTGSLVELVEIPASAGMTEVAGRARRDPGVRPESFSAGIPSIPGLPRNLRATETPASPGMTGSLVELVETPHQDLDELDQRVVTNHAAPTFCRFDPAARDDLCPVAR